jgi:N-acetylmuramoyl-L-alanine amidase
MGYESRKRRGLRVMASDLKVAVDVQHIYRPHKPNDRGSVYTLANGTKTTEASAAVIYAAALSSYLAERGAQVLTNDPTRGILVGHYSSRNQSATMWGAHLYVACHLNAGGGSYALMEYMNPKAHGAAQAMGDSLTGVFSGLGVCQLRVLSDSSRGAVCVRWVGSPTLAVLCEPFFGDHPASQHMLAAPALVSVGRAIGSGIVSWWERSRPKPI